MQKKYVAVQQQRCKISCISTSFATSLKNKKAVFKGIIVFLYMV